jgi:hypothetical protein
MTAIGQHEQSFDANHGIGKYYSRACGGGMHEGGVLLKRTSASVSGATFKDDSARAWVTAMLEAHGGVAIWSRARSLSFTEHMVFGDAGATEWWLSTECTEISTERTYQDWPLFDGQLAFDGTRTWTTNWKLENPPGVNVNMFYRTVAQPWLTQRPDVVLEYTGMRKLVCDSTSRFPTVCMTYKPGMGHSPREYYRLFIDPETRLLKAIEYNITYGAFLDLIELPKEMEALGPFTHVVHAYVQRDGLTFPMKYDTYDPGGQSAGRHLISDVRLHQSFDEQRVKLPAHGVVDTSRAERAR